MVLTDFSDHEHAIDDLAEDNMLPVQKVTLGRRQEELAPVRVLQGGGGGWMYEKNELFSDK